MISFRYEAHTVTMGFSLQYSYVVSFHFIVMRSSSICESSLCYFGPAWKPIHAFNCFQNSQWLRTSFVVGVFLGESVVLYVGSFYKSVVSYLLDILNTLMTLVACRLSKQEGAGHFCFATFS